MLRACPAVLVVLTIGLGLFSTLGTAAADSGDTVTTELQPGLNLAGWTEAEAPIEAIFDAIPQLEAVYAWDAESQRFGVAFGTDSGLLGDLDTLTPGMGLWLAIAGEEPVTWTRPLVPQTGLAPLHEGWNLVVWAGDIPVIDALRMLGDALEVIADEEGREPLSLARGDAFWLKVSAAGEWDRGDAPQRVEGVVLGPDSAPQVGLQVAAVSRGDWGFRSGRTDDQGRFDFWVESDTYTLSVASGLCTLPWSSSDSRVEFAPPRLPRLVVDADVAGLVLNLAAAPSEFCASLKGVVLLSSGVPLEDFTFGIREVSESRTRSILTADDGRFEWSLNSGTYDLSLSAGGCALPWFSFGSPVTMFAPYRALLELEQGVAAGLVVIPSVPLSGACRWVRGVVTDMAGNPRAGVGIDLIFEVGFATHYRHKVTDSDGAFAFWAPRARYQLALRNSGTAGYFGYYGGESGFTTDPSRAMAVNAQASNVTRIAIAYGTISGAVVGSDR